MSHKTMPELCGSAFKKCLFCAKDIRSEAIFCRFCEKDLPAVKIEPEAPLTPNADIPLATSASGNDGSTTNAPVAISVANEEQSIAEVTTTIPVVNDSPLLQSPASAWLVWLLLWSAAAFTTALVAKGIGWGFVSAFAGLVAFHTLLQGVDCLISFFSPSEQTWSSAIHLAERLQTRFFPGSAKTQARNVSGVEQCFSLRANWILPWLGTFFVGLVVTLATHNGWVFLVLVSMCAVIKVGQDYAVGFIRPIFWVEGVRQVLDEVAAIARVAKSVVFPSDLSSGASKFAPNESKPNSQQLFAQRYSAAYSSAILLCVLSVLAVTVVAPGVERSPPAQRKVDATQDFPKEQRREVASIEMAQSGTALTGQQIYEKALKSTVWINNPGISSGSGSLVNVEEKLVITNYHVVFRPSKPQDGKTIHVVNGSLSPSDPRDTSLNLPYKLYSFHFVRATVYVVDMTSRDFSSYLQILDSSGRTIAFDAHSGGNLNARIRFLPPNDGIFQIMATTVDGRVGTFTVNILQVPSNDGMVKSSSSVAPFLFVSFPCYEGGKVIPDKNYYLKNLTNVYREKFKARVVAWDEAKDLAILQLAYLPEGVEPLRLAEESSKPGQLVHSIGNPGGSGALWVYTSGTVRTVPYRKQWQSVGLQGKMNHDAWIVETQSPTNPGDSGGPLINDKVELVGVTQGNSLMANSISIFVDVAEARSFLYAYRSSNRRK